VVGGRANGVGRLSEIDESKLVAVSGPYSDPLFLFAVAPFTPVEPSHWGPIAIRSSHWLSLLSIVQEAAERNRQFGLNGKMY